MYNRPTEPYPNYGGPQNYGGYGGLPQQGYGGPQQGYGGPQPNMRGNLSSQNYQGGPPHGGNFQLPPQGMQQSSGMQFQYSNNSGNRKALFIGINYFGTQNQLGGCINDAQAMKRFAMQNYGYHEDDIVILTDDIQNHQNPRQMPTRANITDAMQWLVAGARPNDSLIFHYSGHGGTAKDLDGDEDDGFDETICPLDFQSAGQIIDDELHDRMVRPLPPGCRLTAFFDSCHSGSALDLPYTYSTKGALKEPNMAKDAGSGAFDAIMSYERGDLFGALSTIGGTATRLFNGNRGRQRTRQIKGSPADVISFSGCKDSQTSADATLGNFNAGAMSFSFLEVMSQNPNQSYLTLLQQVRIVMQNKYSQKPQLSCSHPLDVNLRFTL